MLVLGLIVLTIGAELLVRSASRLAISFGISPLIVGLTVVAFGTSAPELVVSIQSSLQGQSDVALGNVVGSNILNVLLILGLSALIIPLRVSQQLIRFDVPVMIAVSLLVFAISVDGKLGKIDGCVLVLILLGHTVWTIRRSRKESAEAALHNAATDETSTVQTQSNVSLQVLQLVIGLALLVLGARWFVDSAVTLARQFGVSELVIGLTIVALGTSLPEVATSIMAAIKGERDIAVGNVVGSNLFNLMAVLGISGLLSPDGVTVSERALWLDIPVMVAAAIACMPILFSGHVISRSEGGIFLACYLGYTTYLIVAATNAGIERSITWTILGIAIPLTAITIGIGVYRTVKGIDQSEPNVG